MSEIERFYETPHFQRRARKRGLSLPEIKETVIRHDYKRQQRRGEHGGFVCLFKRRIDLRVLVVVAEIKSRDCWLISGYYEAPQ